jgi:poly(A) polymerase
LSRKQISEQALKVLYRLHNAGFAAYLVGGSVRDLLLGRTPKDFDIATDAPPEKVRALFRNCRLIGRRFRLAHIHFGNKIIEVATFRRDTTEARSDISHSEHGQILEDNLFSTSLEEDALRRDFTINALYYNIADFSVVDCTGGMADLQSNIIRIVGDPERRYREDPVRILRAVRFASKLGFNIDPASEAIFLTHAHLLQNVPAARLFEEFQKLLLSGYALKTFPLLQQYDLLPILFPSCQQTLSQDAVKLIYATLANTDERIKDNKPVTPAFVLAAILWESLQQETEARKATDMHPYAAEQLAITHILTEQTRRIGLPKRFAVMVREMWQLQGRLQQLQRKQIFRLLEHPRFRAAYDFLGLRLQAGDSVVATSFEWWTQFQNADEAGQKRLMQTAQTSQGSKRRRSSRKKAAESHDGR